MSADRSNVSGSAGDSRQADEDDRTNSKPGVKPRASRAGTRSVSTLNTEQLARKRANDREAQRAIRQRTREHIERLERRIEELTNNDELRGNPAYEEARRRNAELEEQLRHLQVTLAAQEERQSSPDTNYSDGGYSTPVGESSSFTGPWIPHNVGSSMGGFAPTSVPITQQHPIWVPGNAQYSGYVQSTPDMTATSGSPYASELVVDDLPRQPDPIRSFNSTPSIHSTSQTLPFRGQTDYIWPAGNTIPVIEQPQVAHPLPIMHTVSPAFQNQAPQNMWTLPLQFSPPAYSTRNILGNSVRHFRHLQEQGVTGIGLIGPVQPDLGLVVQQEYPNPVHGLNRTICEVVNSTPFPRIIEKVGSVIVMYSMLQWLIANSYETYTNIPESLLPQTSQFNSVHPVWVSLIMWPRLRNEIINNQERYITSEMEYIYAVSLTLSWPFQPQDAVERVEDRWQATGIFASHARDVGNWGLGEAFQRRYPELRDACRFTE